MEPQTDLFHEPEIEKPNPRNFILIFLLYSIYILIVFIQYYTRPILHSVRFFIESPKYLLLMVITQALPLTACILFIFKTKVGWILLVLLSLVMGSAFIKFMIHDLYSPGYRLTEKIRGIYSVLTFIAIILLAFTKPVIKIFKLDRLLIVSTLLLGIAFSILMLLLAR